MAMETLLAALRRMGYGKEDMTAHGFRGIASTQIREIGKGKFREEVIEAQLAHTTKSKTQGAYDHAEYLEERSMLMQWWSDYLGELKNGAQIIPFKQVG
jgi:integrase